MTENYTPSEEEVQKFYRSKEWLSVRKMALVRDHYLDQEEFREGRLVKGNVVHHLIPLREDWDKRLDLDNLETISAANHNREHKEKGHNNPSAYLATERNIQAKLRRNRKSVVKPEMNEEL